MVRQRVGKIHSENQARLMSRSAWLVPASWLWPGILIGLAYFYTLAPTVTGEDSGELITAAYFFGVPHPPGYPLWTILCGIWTNLLPFKSVAWRANAFSAFCTVIAVLILARTLRLLKFNNLTAGIVSTAAGLTDVVWSQSVITEVYALHLALSAVLMGCFAKWRATSLDRWLCWAALIFGLGISNHHLMGFVALGFGVWALWTSPMLIRRTSTIGLSAALFLIGLSPYAYLPWAGSRDVPLNWGETNTLEKTWQHVTRAQYKGGHEAAPVPLTAGLLAGQLDYGCRWLTRQWTPALMPVILLGMAALRGQRRHRGLASFVVIPAIACGPLFFMVSGPKLDPQDQHVQEVFLISLVWISAVPLAAGFDWLFLWFRSHSLGLSRFLHQFALRYAMPMLGCAGIAILIFNHGPKNNFRNYWYAYDHADNLLASMLPNAIVFPSGDHDTFPLTYRTLVEKHRSDVLLADKYGYIELDLYQDMPNSPGKPRTPQERDRIEEWLIRTSRRPVYYTVKKPSLVENATVVPVGLAYHLLPSGQSVDADECWQKIRYRNQSEASAPEDWAASFILSDYHYARAIQHLVKKDIAAAKDCFKECLSHCRGVRETLNNVASALAEAGLVDDAIQHYEQACRGDWRYSPARWNLAKIFKAIGRLDWAAKVFEDLTRASPEDFRPYGELGFLAESRERSGDEARYWWYESLRRNPQQPQIIAALAALDQPQATSQPTTAAESASQMRATPIATRTPNSDSGLSIEFGAAPTTQAASGVSASSSPTIELTPTTLDFGRVVAGQVTQAHVQLSNSFLTPQEVCVSKVSCGCVSATPASQLIGEQGSTPWEVMFNGSNKLGPVRETIGFATAEGAMSVELTIRAEVVPILAATPAELRFSALAGQRPTKQSLVVAHAEDQPFSISQVRLAGHQLQAHWNAEAAESRHIVDLELVEPTGSWRGVLEIQTSLPDSPKLLIPLICESRLPFRLTPALVYFGRVSGPTKVKRSIRISPIDNAAQLEFGLDTSRLPVGISAQLLQGNGDRNEHVVDIEIDPQSMSAGRAAHTLRVGASGTWQEVPIHVVISQ